MDTTAVTMLHVSGKGPDSDIPLDPSGAILGRAATCHIVLDSPKISRRHARIFKDPFGRWIVEDLESRNGVWIGENRVRTQAMIPGEIITIGPYHLSLTEPPSVRIEADPTATATSAVIEEDDSAGPVITAAVDDYDALTGVRLKQLNAIIDRLSELTNPNDLYPEVCRSLARTPETFSLVLRLPTGSQPISDSPKVIACHLGGRAPGSFDIQNENLHISRRVIHAVRTTGNAVMASSAQTSERDMMLTVVDERMPRAVLCSPLGDFTETVDALYLDIPSGHATSEMLDFVRAIARQVSLTRKGLLFAEAKAERRAVDRQLDLAREIQTKLTPSNLKETSGVDTALYYKPAMWVGGDYCDMWPLADGKIAFTIADVSGKGLSAAMVMSNLQAALRTTMTFCPDVADAMGHIDRHLSDSMPERMFITMFLGVFDPSDGKLQYVNAGHILPIVIRPDGLAGELGKPTNPPVGVFVGSFKASEEILEPDTAILIVTDGITEVMSPEDEEFGPERMRKALDGTKGKSAEELVKIVSSSAKKFRTDLPQQDDITVFALRNAKLVIGNQ